VFTRSTEVQRPFEVHIEITREAGPVEHLAPYNSGKNIGQVLHLRALVLIL
jgi:hypothetical protein